MQLQAFITIDSSLLLEGNKNGQKRGRKQEAKAINKQYTLVAIT
jgi:hypothetical protein